MTGSEPATSASRLVVACSSRLIKATPEAVWKLATRPCSIVEWNSLVARCEVGKDDVGRLTRKYTLAAKPDVEPVVIDEVELYRSDLTMTMTYMAEMKLLPITDYSAQLLVTPEEGAARVTNRSRFLSPIGNEAAAIVENFYQLGLGGLARLTEA